MWQAAGETRPKRADEIIETDVVAVGDERYVIKHVGRSGLLGTGDRIVIDFDCGRRWVYHPEDTVLIDRWLSGEDE